MHLSSGQVRILLIFSLLQRLSVRPQSQILQTYLEADLQRCHQCFANQIEPCLNFYKAIQEPADIVKLLTALFFIFDQRHIYWLELAESNAKVLAKRSRLLAESAIPKEFSLNSLRKNFLDAKERPGRFQLCSAQNHTESPRLVTHFMQRGYTELTIWYYMSEDITPLLLHELSLLHMPVPHSYASCGLTYFQAYAGRTLSEFGNAELSLRLRLAQQLLDVALQLTYGFDDFRIYVTDFTVDNFAYDDSKLQLTIIDMDTVVLVDAAVPLQYYSKYIPLPGDGFTYDVKAFCVGQLVDANIYQACILLRDFLLKDIFGEHEGLRNLLNGCVLCSDELCDLRFQYAYDLIKLFKMLVE